MRPIRLFEINDKGTACTVGARDSFRLGTKQCNQTASQILQLEVLGGAHAITLSFAEIVEYL